MKEDLEISKIPNSGPGSVVLLLPPSDLAHREGEDSGTDVLFSGVVGIVVMGGVLILYVIAVSMSCTFAMRVETKYVYLAYLILRLVYGIVEYQKQQNDLI